MLGVIASVMLMGAVKPAPASAVVDFAATVLGSGQGVKAPNSSRSAPELLSGLATCRVYEGGFFSLQLETRVRQGSGPSRSSVHGMVIDLNGIPWDEAPTDPVGASQFYSTHLNNQINLGERVAVPSTAIVSTSTFDLVASAQQRLAGKSSTMVFDALGDFAVACFMRAVAAVPGVQSLSQGPLAVAVSEEVVAPAVKPWMQRWYMRWLLGALNIFQAFATCMPCLNDELPCNWNLCISEIIQLILSFSGIGGTVLLVIEALDIICLALATASAQYCQQFCGNVLPQWACKSFAFCDNFDAQGCKCGENKDGKPCP